MESLAELGAYVERIGRGEVPPTPLCQIMAHAGTDKSHGRHNYTLIYDLLLRERRGEPLAVLEIGIGTIDPSIPASMHWHAGTIASKLRRLVRSQWWDRAIRAVFTAAGRRLYRPGASLRGWAEYFARADIVGADIDPTCLFTEPHIRTFQADQLSTESMELLFASIGRPVDVIIDDGLHTLEAHCTTVALALPHLVPGGLLFVEDILRDHLPELRRWLASHLAGDDCEWVLLELPCAANDLDNNLCVVRKR